jgi:hypothetical protein
MLKLQANTHGTAHKGVRTSEGVKGKKARLTEDISFFTSVSRSESSRKKVKAGTIITCSYMMTITDLFIFKFSGGHEFGLRPSKFEWID